MQAREVIWSNSESFTYFLSLIGVLGSSNVYECRLKGSTAEDPRIGIFATFKRAPFCNNRAILSHLRGTVAHQSHAQYWLESCTASS